MKPSNQSEKEEKLFLSLCSPHDRAILTGQAEMTRLDFERLTYLIMEMGMTAYTQTIFGRYMDFTKSSLDQLNREQEILQEYPNYFEDEDIYGTYQKWIDDFIGQVPEEHKAYCIKRLVNKDYID